MSTALWAKAVLLAIPLAIFIGSQLPFSRRLRFVLGIGLGLVGGLVLNLIIPAGILSYLVSFAIMASIYAILTLGLNVQWGSCGLLNFGIAAFFAVGAFTSALFTTIRPTGIAAQYTQQVFGLGMPFLVGMLAAAVISGLLAWGVASATLRLRLDYLAISTIGIAEITRYIFQTERWLANGPQPLRGIPRPLGYLIESPPEWLPGPVASLFGSLSPRDYTYIYLVIAVLILTVLYLAIERLMRSPWGRVLRAIREEEESAAMSGKNLYSYKVQAFVLGAMIMGMGGALYAHYMGSIDYGHFVPLQGTFLIVVMLILGGSGNNRGAILGAFVIWGVWVATPTLAGWLAPLLEVISPDLPGRSPYLRFLFISIILLFILLYRPQGLLAEEKTVSKMIPEESIGTKGCR